MSAAQQAAVLAAMNGFPGYRAPTMLALGRAAGVRGEDLYSALRALRYAGKVEWDVLRLSPSLRAAQEARCDGADLCHSPAGVPTDDAARPCTGQAVPLVAPGDGRGADERQAAMVAAVQEMALADDPAQAAAMLRRAWAPLWQRLCEQARATGQRPVALLVEAVERGL